MQQRSVYQYFAEMSSAALKPARLVMSTPVSVAASGRLGVITVALLTSLHKISNLLSRAGLPASCLLMLPRCQPGW